MERPEQAADGILVGRVLFEGEDRPVNGRQVVGHLVKILLDEIVPVDSHAGVISFGFGFTIINLKSKI